MDKEIRASLNNIINYLYADEYAHSEELGGPDNDHIYEDVDRIADWLAKTQPPKTQ